MCISILNTFAYGLKTNVKIDLKLLSIKQKMWY